MGEFERRKAELERRASRLIGRRLVRVRYYELRYESGEPGFRRGDLDELDFGFDLDLEPASTFHVTWDGEFFEYGLTVNPGSRAEQLLDYAAWDVTAGGGWEPLVGRQITRVGFFWRRVGKTEDDSPGSPSAGYLGGQSETVPSGAERIWYPQDLVIEFESGERVFASAAQWLDEQRRLVGGSDAVCVMFGDEVARRYGVGREPD